MPFLDALLNLALWFLGVTVLLAAVGVTVGSLTYWALRYMFRLRSRT